MNKEKYISPFKIRGIKGHTILTKTKLLSLIEKMPTGCEIFNFKLRQSKRDKHFYYIDIEVVKNG